MRPRIAVLASLGLLALQANPARANEPAAKPAPAAKKAPETQVQANTPPFSDGIFPCSGCHDPKSKVDTTRRQLQFHDEQQDVLQHGEESWCFECHDAQNRDQLRSAAGRPIAFTESYRLCGQCHGDKLRDWKVGIHGKRTGRWDGDKTYFLCVNCHNPHAPAWKGVSDQVIDGKRIVSPTLELTKPEPRPERPEEMRQ